MATARQQEPGSSLARFDSIHDLYRNCILNELYYGHRLSLFTRTGFWLDIIVVLGSGTSGIAGWIIWTKYPALAALWAVVTGVATLLATLKPVLQTDAKIKRNSSLFSAYRQLAVSMKMVVEEIHEAGGIRRGITRRQDVRITFEGKGRLPCTGLACGGGRRQRPERDACVGQHEDDGSRIWNHQAKRDFFNDRNGG